MRAKLSLALLAVLVLNACGSKFQTPALNLPATFSQQSEQAQIKDLANWWEGFADPTLNDLVGKALANSIDLQLAASQIKVAKINYGISNRANLPTLGLNATQTWQGPGLDDLNSSYQLSTPLNWSLNLFASSANKRLYQASIEDYRSAYLLLISKVVQAYFDYKYASFALELNSQAIELNQEFLDFTSTQQQAGLINHFHSHDNPYYAAKQLQDLQARRSQLLNLRNTSHLQLAYYLLEPELGELELHIGSFPVLPASLPGQLLVRRPDIRGATQRLAASNSLNNSAIMSLLPQISLSASYGSSANSWEQLFDTSSWSLIPRISLPILGGGWRKFKLAKENYQNALINYKKTVYGALLDVETNLANYEQARSQLLVDIYKLEIDLLELEHYRDLEQSGLNSRQETLKTQLKVIKAQDSLLQSKRALNRQLINVYQAIGGDWGAS